MIDYLIASFDMPLYGEPDPVALGIVVRRPKAPIGPRYKTRMVPLRGDRKIKSDAKRHASALFHHRRNKPIGARPYHN